jgi:hypothetical protein
MTSREKFDESDILSVGRLNFILPKIAYRLLRMAGNRLPPDSVRGLRSKFRHVSALRMQMRIPTRVGLRQRTEGRNRQETKGRLTSLSLILYNSGWLFLVVSVAKFVGNTRPTRCKPVCRLAVRPILTKESPDFFVPSQNASKPAGSHSHTL